MSVISIALIVLGCVVGLIVYAQIGWLLTSAWRRKWPGAWDDFGQTLCTIFWPVVLIVLYLLWPTWKGFIWLATAPQRRIVARRERIEQEERERRYLKEKQEREEARAREARAAEEAKSPAVEIAKINDEMVKLAARKAELERRPDATRH